MRNLKSFVQVLNTFSFVWQTNNFHLNKFLFSSAGRKRCHVDDNNNNIL